MNKIEKSTSLGEDLVYKPKIWWFAHLEWIGDFMKTRTDSTPLSARAKIVRTEKANDEAELFEFEEEIDETGEQCFTAIEYSEYETEAAEGEPSIKKQKTYQKPNRAATAKQEDSGIRTIEYTLINEDTNEVVPEATEERVQQFVNFQESHADNLPTDKYKRRSKAFGKYIAALLIEITDDKIFFELQRNITNSIHEAGINQNERKKS